MLAFLYVAAIDVQSGTANPRIEIRLRQFDISPPRSQSQR